jgi:pimeloyl-ACP methyl ester carboxylesterase
MKVWWRISAIGVLVAGMMIVLGSNPSMAEPRAHVYLLRGLMNIFSLGMDTLSDELNRRGVYATVDNHADWEDLADQAAAKYKAGTEGPIIIIGHSLGADAAMEMAAYLGRRGVPVALVVLFDGTDASSASSNVGRVLNLTKHYYVSRGPGFRGSISNVDLSNDADIDHLNIDKSPRLHARVIGEVLGIVGTRRMPGPGATTPSQTPVSAPAPSGAPGGPTVTPAADGAAKPDVVPATPATPAAPAKSGDGANAMDATKPAGDGGTPVIALPERTPAGSSHPAN